MKHQYLSLKQILKLATLLLFSLTSIYSTHAQTLEWAKTSSGAGGVQSHTNMVQDSNKNIYFAGRHDDDVIFDDLTYPTSTGYPVIYKYDSQGNRVWNKELKSNSFSYINNRLIIDKSDNIYISGRFIENLTIDTKVISGDPNKITYYILILSKEGNYVNIITFEDSNFNLKDFDVDTEGNIHLVGIYSTNITFLGQSLSTSSTKLLASKMNISKQSIWMKSISLSSYNQENIRVKADKNNNTVIGSTFRDSVEISKDTYIRSTGNSDLFILKYDKDGNYQWHLSDESPDAGILIRDLGIDSNNNIYVTTNYFTTTTIGNLQIISDGRYSDFFLLKISDIGTPIWVKKGESTSYVNGPWALHISEDDIITVGISYSPNFKLEDNILQTNGNKYYNTNACIAEYSDNGSLLNYYQINSSFSSTCYGVVNDQDIYASGSFQTSLIYKGDTLTNIPPSGNTKLFLLKIKPVVTNFDNNQDLNDEINIYPNPTSNRVLVIGDQSNINSINIIDFTGKIVRTITKEFDTISVENLIDGIYFIKFNTNKGVISKRLIKL